MPFQTNEVSPQSPKRYRVDKRFFRAGDIIRTASEFLRRHSETGKMAEGLLEEKRPPNKPKRWECLMLFEDEECARDHWCKMANSQLYTVAIDETAIAHKADMRLVDAIGNAVDDGRDPSKLIDDYWMGNMTDKPCVEILLESGRIIELLGTNEQRLKEQKKRWLG